MRINRTFFCEKHHIIRKLRHARLRGPEIFANYFQLAKTFLFIQQHLEFQMRQILQHQIQEVYTLLYSKQR